jgi:hypothetical protein
MTSPSKLSVVNEALRALGVKSLVTLTDDVEARYVMVDEAYDTALDYVLERGDWHFAAKDVAPAADLVTPALPSYEYVFDKPGDWIKTVRVYVIQDGEPYDIDFQDYEGHLHANESVIRLRYLRNTATDVATWTQVAASCFSLYLAAQCTHRLTGSRASRADLLDDFDKMLRSSKFEDAKRSRLRYRQTGRLVRSRLGVLNREHG